MDLRKGSYMRNENKIQVEVFWVVTPCSDVGGYQTFRRCMLRSSQIKHCIISSFTYSC